MNTYTKQTMKFVRSIFLIIFYVTNYSSISISWSVFYVDRNTILSHEI
jgi:hypothetical protein